MVAVSQDIILPAGDYREIEVTITEPDNSPVSSVNLSVNYALSKNSRSSPIFTKSSNNDEIDIEDREYTYQASMSGNIIQFEEVTDTTMVAIVKILPEDTEELKGGYYYHEVQIKDEIDNKPYTVLKGKVQIINTII